METVFGPPSEPIDVAAFVQSAKDLGPAASVPDSDVLAQLPDEQLYKVLAECSVADIQKSLFDVWNNPRLSAHLLREHELAIESLCANSKKRRKAFLTDPAELPSEVVDLQKELNSVQLDSWKLQSGSATFTRSPRNSDYNVLKQPKSLSDTELPQETQAIIIASVYKRTSWNPGLFTRTSQHALLSSQTLRQLFDAIPCPSKEIPHEIIEDGKIIGYSPNVTTADNGCVICIEGYAYGDARSDDDYAHKLMEQLKKHKEPRVKRATSSMQGTLLHSLIMRINEPYWLLHDGNCEHYIVIEQIRLMHNLDPSSGYPLALQITPLLLDLCRSCGKVPAVWSIVSDSRLGESPYLICRSCWRGMEEGRGGRVVVVPLPEHRAGCTTTSAPPSDFIASLESYDDALEWLNDTLEYDSASNPELADLDQHVTQLIATLEVAYEDTSSQLERIVDDVSRNVSRLTYDLHFMKDAATTLQPILGELIRNSKEAVPEKTNDALDQLRLLDSVKKRMEAARDVLREAESWSTLELEVTSLLAEHNYVKAAGRLSEANKSMIVFQNTPEYDPRKTLLVNLQNQLEASLSSALVSAIKAQNIAACREYYSIFSAISRESEFRNYYYASRKSTLVSMWQDIKLSDSDTGASADSQSIVDYLPRFYAAFTTLLNQERTTIPAIFPDPAATLSNFITSTISTLQPTVSQRLTSLASFHGDRAIIPLMSVFRATEEFAVGVEKIMEKLKYTSQPPVDTTKTDASARHARRRSSRMSMSWRGGPPPVASLTVAIMELDWDQDVFQPFIEFQMDYGTLERFFLEHSLRELANDDIGDQTNIDYTRLLRERAVDVFGIAEGSLSRCSTFTHGYGSVGLVQALDSTFESFIHSWTTNVQTAMTVAASIAPSLISQDDLSDMDFTAQDWSTSQILIRLLASGHAYEERLSNFETKLRTKLAEFANRFRLSRDDPLNFTIAATRGQSLLLEQSPLNTVELHSLFNSVDSDQPYTARLGVAGQPTHILVRARQAVHAFATACQASLQQTILSPLKRYLKPYPSMSVWSQQDDQKSKRSGGTTNNLQIPTFSLSPSETVQRVAEGLLNLPRLFEVYADDDALSFSLYTLPFINVETIKSISEQSEASTAAPMHRRRSSLTAAKPQPIDPEAVSSAWLFSLGKVFVNYVNADVLPQIPSLSRAGVAQLASDLEYLSNIVRVLNVESEELEEWRRCLAMGEEEGRKAFAQAATDSVLRHVGSLREWDK